MGYLSERVSYLRGLMDGLKIEEESNEGKLFKLIIDVVDDIAISVEDIEDTQNELLDSVDDLEERLDDVENDLYEECDDESDSCCCGDEETEYTDLECPNCGAEIELDQAVIDSEKNVLICPNCKEEIQIEWVDDCDGECSCCGHDCGESDDQE